MPIPKSPFGRLSHLSTRTLFGAASLANVSQSEADRTLDVLLQYGVNHIDVAASYGDAELRIAPWLKRYHQHFFVATKTGERKAVGAKEELHRSLDRMGIDHVDLWATAINEPLPISLQARSTRFIFCSISASPRCTALKSRSSTLSPCSMLDAAPPPKPTR